MYTVEVWMRWKESCGGLSSLQIESCLRLYWTTLSIAASSTHCPEVWVPPFFEDGLSTAWSTFTCLWKPRHSTWNGRYVSSRCDTSHSFEGHLSLFAINDSFTQQPLFWWVNSSPLARGVTNPTVSLNLQVGRDYGRRRLGLRDAFSGSQVKRFGETHTVTF